MQTNLYINVSVVFCTIYIKFVPIVSRAETRKGKIASSSFEQCRSCLEFPGNAKGKIENNVISTTNITHGTGCTKVG